MPKRHEGRRVFETLGYGECVARHCALPSPLPRRSDHHFFGIAAADRIEEYALDGGELPAVTDRNEQRRFEFGEGLGAVWTSRVKADVGPVDWKPA